MEGAVLFCYISLFPDLEIGGPALCENDAWADNFLKYMSEHKVDLDFFSYHLYTSTPQRHYVL